MIKSPQFPKPSPFYRFNMLWRLLAAGGTLIRAGLSLFWKRR